MLTSAERYMVVPMKVAGLTESAVIYGGPYHLRADVYFGVCLLEPVIGPAILADVWLPIRDFSVPSSVRDTNAAVRQTLIAMLSGRPVYVGCMGGLGRTGLFLALIAKVAGVKDPVAFVRENYAPKAVETRAQEKWVADFPVARLRLWLWAQLLTLWVSEALGKAIR